VTGKSSIESAISQTKRMIEMLDRALGEAGAEGLQREERPRVEVVGRIGAFGGVGRVGT
jgi:hypothetical protein